MLDFIKHEWTILKGYGSIINARLTALSGLLIGAVGALDWSPLFSLTGSFDSGFSRAQLMWTGIFVFAKGIADEVVRRKNANL